MQVNLVCGLSENVRVNLITSVSSLGLSDKDGLQKTWSHFWCEGWSKPSYLHWDCLIRWSSKHFITLLMWKMVKTFVSPMRSSDPTKSQSSSYKEPKLFRVRPNKDKHHKIQPSICREGNEDSDLDVGRLCFSHWKLSPLTWTVSTESWGKEASISKHLRRWAWCSSAWSMTKTHFPNTGFSCLET